MLITVIGRGHSGTRAMSHTLSASGVFMGDTLNRSGDLVPGAPMYRAAKIVARHVRWLGGTRWDFSALDTMPIPAEFEDLVRTYLAGPLGSRAERKGWKLPETTLCYPWIRRMFPEARYVFWTRNPRDCILGEHLTDDLARWGVGSPATDDPRLRRAHSWIYQHEIVRASPRPEHAIDVRFEDFVLDQRRTLVRLEAFLGFPLASIPVKREAANRHASDGETNFYDFLEPAMRACGYEIPTPDAPRPVPVSAVPTPATEGAPWTPTWALETFRDVPVMPFTLLIEERPWDFVVHQGGPVWPDWHQRHGARFRLGDRPHDLPPVLEPTAAVIEEPIAWAGPICRHFGHQIADFSARIVPTLALWPDAVFAFGARPGSGFSSLAATPRFFREILAWFGIPEERVRIVIEPTLARHLVVAPQAEVRLSPRRSTDVLTRHLDLLDDLARRRLGAAESRGTLYVSRAGQPARFVGEREIEAALARAGVETVRPEDLPLPEQLGKYHRAERIVFAEGSALHALQLLGRGLGEVHVLRRRPQAAPRVDSFVGPRASRLSMHAVGRTLLFPELPSGKPLPAKGICIADEATLLATFDGLGIPLRRHWSTDRFRSACDEDLREWLTKARTSPWFANPEVVERLRATVVEGGFPHLLPILDEAGAAPTRRRGGWWFPRWGRS